MSIAKAPICDLQSLLPRLSQLFDHEFEIILMTSQNVLYIVINTAKRQRDFQEATF